MEKSNGTVTINITEYDELRKIKESIKGNENTVIIYYDLFNSEYIRFQNKEEAINNIEAANHYLVCKLRELDTLDEIRKMTIKQFIKWRKRKNNNKYCL